MVIQCLSYGQPPWGICFALVCLWLTVNPDCNSKFSKYIVLIKVNKQKWVKDTTALQQLQWGGRFFRHTHVFFRHYKKHSFEEDYLRQYFLCCVKAFITLTVFTWVHSVLYLKVLHSHWWYSTLPLFFISHCHTHNHSADCPSGNTTILKLYGESFEVFIKYSGLLSYCTSQSFDMYFSFLI